MSQSQQRLSRQSTALHAAVSHGRCGTLVLPPLHSGHVQQARRQRALRLRLSAIAATGGGGDGSRDSRGSDSSRKAAAKLIQRSSGGKQQPDDPIDIEAGMLEQRSACFAMLSCATWLTKAFDCCATTAEFAAAELVEESSNSSNSRRPNQLEQFVTRLLLGFVRSIVFILKVCQLEALLCLHGALFVVLE
jgi:hypothetical protein